MGRMFLNFMVSDFPVFTWMWTLLRHEWGIAVAITMQEDNVKVAVRVRILKLISYSDTLAYQPQLSH